MKGKNIFKWNNLGYNSPVVSLEKIKNRLHTYIKNNLYSDGIFVERFSKVHEFSWRFSPQIAGTMTQNSAYQDMKINELIDEIVDSFAYQISEDDIMIEEDNDNDGELLTVFIGFYENDEFNGCAWDNHEQSSEWIVNGVSLWNDSDGDEETMRMMFSHKVGENVIEMVDNKFNNNFYLDDRGDFKDWIIRKSKSWDLKIEIAFSFNGTKEDAIEKLMEDVDYLEDDVFMRDAMEYRIIDKSVSQQKGV